MELSPSVASELPAALVNKCLDLDFGFWLSSAMSVSGWLTATRSMMLLYWVTLCLLVLLFIYLDPCFPPDGLWYKRRELIGWRRYFPRLLWLKIHLRVLVKPGTRKLSPASLSPPPLQINLKLLINCKNTSEFPGKLFIINPGVVEWNVILWPISFVCSGRVQWSSLHVSLPFFVYFSPLLRDESHLFKEKSFCFFVCLWSRQWLDFVSVLYRHYLNKKF